jgi:hypothetical protein
MSVRLVELLPAGIWIPARRMLPVPPVSPPGVAGPGDADGVVRLVGAVRLRSRGDERLDVRPVEVRAHHAHAFTVAPVHLAAGEIELHLLGRVRHPHRHDGRLARAVEVGALDVAVVDLDAVLRVPHVGPVDVATRRVDLDAVGLRCAARDQSGRVASVRAGAHHARVAQIQIEQRRNARRGAARIGASLGARRGGCGVHGAGRS